MGLPWLCMQNYVRINNVAYYIHAFDTKSPCKRKSTIASTTYSVIHFPWHTYHRTPSRIPYTQRHANLHQPTTDAAPHAHHYPPTNHAPTTTYLPTAATPCIIGPRSRQAAISLTYRSVGQRCRDRVIVSPKIANFPCGQRRGRLIWRAAAAEMLRHVLNRSDSHYGTLAKRLDSDGRLCIPRGASFEPPPRSFWLDLSLFLSDSVPSVCLSVCLSLSLSLFSLFSSL